MKKSKTQSGVEGGDSGVDSVTGKLAATNESDLEALRIENHQLKEKISKLEKQVRTDPLTGISNRRDFKNTLERLTATHQRYDLPLVLMLIDIDGMKQINDGFGHAVGDQFLQDVAAYLNNSIRKSDHVSRIGGDEFAILLPGIDEAGAANLAHRLKENFQLAVSKDFESGMSVGFAALQEAESEEEFFVRVDRALYESKREQ